MRPLPALLALLALLLQAGPALAGPGPGLPLIVKPDGKLVLQRQRVSAPGPRGFAYRPFAASGAPRLKDRLQQLRPATIAIRFPLKRSRPRTKDPRMPTATPRWTSLDLVSLLAEIRGAGVGAWELHVGRRRCASLRFLGPGARAQLEASDLRFSARTDANGVRWINVRSLSRRRTAAAPRTVRLVVDFGMPLPRLCKILGKLDGDRVALSVHTGPY